MFLSLGGNCNFAPLDQWRSSAGLALIRIAAKTIRDLGAASLRRLERVRRGSSDEAVGERLNACHAAVAV